jgi:hypothetical protein
LSGGADTGQAGADDQNIRTASSGVGAVMTGTRISGISDNIGCQKQSDNRECHNGAHDYRALSRARYRGAEAEERRAQRRGQLIAAAVQVYGERGYQNATVKAVCEAAGLTERYFYESFANSEALLLASFQTVTDLLLQKIELAGEAAGGDGEHRALAILRAYFGTLQCEPRSARVFLVEIRGVSKLVDEALASRCAISAGCWRVC